MPGKLYNVPEFIVGRSEGDFERIVLDSISSDWEQLYNVMQNAIKRKRHDDSTRTTKFGKKLVRIGSQQFRSIIIPKLLRLTVFGGEEFLRFRQNKLLAGVRGLCYCTLRHNPG